MNKPATAEPEKAQMTIFYGGQVIVFNDFPADKAKEVMLLASKGTSQSHNTPFASNPATNNQPAFAPNLARNSVESSTSIATSSSGVVPPNFGNKVISERAQPSPQPLAAGNFLWLPLFLYQQVRKIECLEHHVEYVCWLKPVFIYLLQIYQLQGELHCTDSWRREKIGRHFGTKYWKTYIFFLNSYPICLCNFSCRCIK